MIDKLLEVDYDWWCLEDEWDLEQLMIKVLNIVEENGMSPPPQKPDEFLEFQEPAWEPEDE